MIGQTYRLKLEMVGTTLKLYVNGVLKVSVTDTTLTAAGRAGIMTGRVAHHRRSPTPPGCTSTTSRSARRRGQLDSKGNNHGAYVNGVTRGVAGCPARRRGHRRAFDGVNDYVQVLNTTGIPVGRARGRSRRGSRPPARPAR